MMWPSVELQDFCQTTSGGTPSRDNVSRYYGGDIPWVKSGELLDTPLSDTQEKITEPALKESSAKIVPAGAVLVAMYGATVGRTGLLEIDAATNQAVCSVIPDDRLASSRYVWYALRASYAEFLLKRVGGGQPNISQQIIRSTKLPLPTPSEQARIVELLDEADRLRRLSREASAKVERILPALFLKMFGDPAMNPKGWDVKPLRKVIQSIEAGWSSQSDARLRNSGEMGVLKVSAVTSGIFLPEEHKAVPEVAPERVLITPRRGDLLFSRANTRELVAATCIVDDDYPELFLPDKIWRITPFPELAKSTFLKELFWQSGIRDKFRAASSGSSGSMLNISQEAVLRTEIPVPPLQMQEKFNCIFWLVLDTSRQTNRAGIQVESTWRELLKRAVSGELTAEWREAHMKELLAEMAVQARHLNLPAPQEAAV